MPSPSLGNLTRSLYLYHLEGRKEELGSLKMRDRKSSELVYCVSVALIITYNNKNDSHYLSSMCQILSKDFYTCNHGQTNLKRIWRLWLEINDLLLKRFIQGSYGL